MFRAVIAAALALGVLTVGAPEASAQQSQRVSQQTVGPWSLAGFINPQGTPYCVASRVVQDTNIMFARFQQGYGLAVQSPNFWLTKGSAVQVRVVAASMGDNTVQGRALSSNIILAQLTTDPAVIRQMAGLPEIVVTAEGQTVTIPLDGFDAALTELDRCLAQRGQMGSASDAPPAPAVTPTPSSPQAPGSAPSSPTHRLPIPEERDRRLVPVVNIAKDARPAAYSVFERSGYRFA